MFEKILARKQIKVSVIVPVYNGEVHLRQCLDSICAQTLQDIEIICVDDGSTDSTPDILAEYAAKDPRFRLFRQKNLYLGIARNRGIDMARGEYLMMWDGDDFFAEKALEKLYTKAKACDADICVCGAARYFGSLNKKEPVNANYMNKKRLPDTEVFNRISHPKYILNFTTAVVWNKLFRRAFVNEKGLRFQAVRVGEDAYFTMQAMCLADRITTIPDGLVSYRVNQANSLVGTFSKTPIVPIQSWVALAERLEEKNVFPEQSFVNKAVDSVIYALRNQKDYDAFVQVVDYLKSEALDKLHIIDGRGVEYYYSPWHCEFVSRVWHDTPSQLMIWLAHFTYIQMTEKDAERRIKADQANKNKKKVKALEEQLKNLKAEYMLLQQKLSKEEGEP